MKKTGLFYSFNTTNTAKIAELIEKAFGEAPIEKVNAEELTEKQFVAYENLILGVPTWFDGELPNYWDEFVPAIEDTDLKGKTVAIFGLGDQQGYPQNFGDAVGIMAQLLEEQGAKIVGYTSAADYKFDSSRALRNDKFCGLMIDFENQAELIDQRIEKWVKQLKKQLK